MSTTRITLSLLTVLMGMSFTLTPVSGIYFAQKSTMGLSLLDYGNVFILFITGALFGAYGSGHLIKRGKKPFILRISPFLLFVSFLLFALENTVLTQITLAYPLLMVIVFLLGLGFGALWSAVSLHANANPFSSYYAKICLGAAITPTLFALCASFIFWWVAPLALSAFSLVTTIQSFATPWDRAKTEEKAELADVATKGHFWGLFFSSLFYGLCEGMLSVWGLIFLQKEKSFGLLAAILTLSVFWLLRSLSVAFLSRRIALMQSPQFFLFSAGLLAFSLCIFAKSSSSALALLCFLLAGLGLSPLYPMLFETMKEAFKKISYFSLQMLTWSYLLGFGLGSAGMSSMERRTGLSSEKIYLAAAVIALLMMGIGGVCMSKRKKLSSADSAL